jgi:hypothetical protein
MRRCSGQVFDGAISEEVPIVYRGSVADDVSDWFEKGTVDRRVKDRGAAAGSGAEQDGVLYE